MVVIFHVGLTTRKAGILMSYDCSLSHALESLLCFVFQIFFFGLIQRCVVLIVVKPLFYKYLELLMFVSAYERRC